MFLHYESHQENRKSKPFLKLLTLALICSATILGCRDYKS